MYCGKGGGPKKDLAEFREPKKGPKRAQNGLKIEKKTIFSFGSKCTKMASKWSKTVPIHIYMAF